MVRLPRGFPPHARLLLRPSRLTPLSTRTLAAHRTSRPDFSEVVNYLRRYDLTVAPVKQRSFRITTGPRQAMSSRGRVESDAASVPFFSRSGSNASTLASMGIYGDPLYDVASVKMYDSDDDGGSGETLQRRLLAPAATAESYDDGDFYDDPTRYAGGDGGGVADTTL